MRIVCPACQATYEVPSAVLALGRKLRCAMCATDFQAHAPLFARPPAMRVPEPLAVPAQETHQPPPLRELSFAPAVAAGWAASLVVLIGLGWASVAWRMPIMQAWPPATRLYAALGYV